MSLILLVALIVSPTPPITPRVYLPVLVNVPTWINPARTAVPPTVQPLPPAPTPLVVRPSTHEELRKVVATPGTYVVPMPGVYRLSRNLKLAPRVTLDGLDAVTIIGKTIELYEADGAVVRRLTVQGAAGDGIRVSHTHSALIEHVNVSGSGDGEIDVAEMPEDRPSVIIIRDSVIGPARKAMLLGDPDQPQDARLTVVLDRVTFNDCVVRVPKTHWALVLINGGTVFRWSGPRLDVQLGGRVRIKNTTWIAGKDSLPSYYLPTGGTVEDLGGNVYKPWKGAE